MAMSRPIRAVFPGMFDPITNGHVDVIRRARNIVDELVVAVGHNPEKCPLFSTQERLEMVREVVDGADGIRVEAYHGLTAEFVQQVHAQVLIRGIRDNVDLHYELEQANINMVVGDVETIFLLTRDQYAMTSSTYIKQIVELGCLDPKRLTHFVPLSVAHRLRKRLASGMPAELSSQGLRPND
jgi:pantetheine-phosphate adenylyltransferase